MLVRALFCRKISDELREFKESVLTKEKECIYGESYRIEVYVNIYEILMELAEKMPETVMLLLLKQTTGIIASLYAEWLKREDSSYEELKKYVLEEVS